MGALHRGHLSLIECAEREVEYIVVSIFVNPLQFNNAEDLIKYPRNEEADIEQLQTTSCNVVYLPEVKGIYPKEGTAERNYDLGSLEAVMEGEHRPGHFQGVAAVLDSLFSQVMPNRVYMGEKDFQQVAVVRKLVSDLELPIEVVSCPIIREDSGLAMSSRNERLNAQQRQNASALSRELFYLSRRFAEHGLSKKEMEESKQRIAQIPECELEYLHLAREEDLQPIHPLEEANQGKRLRLFVAASIGGVRLIDNVGIE
jgi:pantoate--beta-alanine ligase